MSRPLSLHCEQCAFIATTIPDAVQHASDMPGHAVTGPGSQEGTTFRITIEEN